MQNRNLGILVVALLFSFALAACSSCGGQQARTRALPDADITEGSGDVAEDVSADADADVSDGSGNTADEAFYTLCSPSVSIYCLLDLEYSTVAELELCMGDSEPLIEITEMAGPQFSATNSRMFLCPGYLRDGSIENVDVMAMTNGDTFISVSEAYSYPDVMSLLGAVSALNQAYDRDCTLRLDLGIDSAYECDVNGRLLYVSLSGSSDEENNALIVNYISDVEHFSMLLDAIQN